MPIAHEADTKIDRQVTYPLWHCEEYLLPMSLFKNVEKI